MPLRQLLYRRIHPLILPGQQQRSRGQRGHHVLHVHARLLRLPGRDLHRVHRRIVVLGRAEEPVPRQHPLPPALELREQLHVHRRLHGRARHRVHRVLCGVLVLPRGLAPVHGLLDLCRPERQHHRLQVLRGVRGAGWRAVHDLRSRHVQDGRGLGDLRGMRRGDILGHVGRDGYIHVPDVPALHDLALRLQQPRRLPMHPRVLRPRRGRVRGVRRRDLQGHPRVLRVRGLLSGHILRRRCGERVIHVPVLPGLLLRVPQKRVPNRLPLRSWVHRSRRWPVLFLQQGHLQGDPRHGRLPRLLGRDVPTPRRARPRVAVPQLPEPLPLGQRELRCDQLLVQGGVHGPRRRGVPCVHCGRIQGRDRGISMPHLPSQHLLRNCRLWHCWHVPLVPSQLGGACGEHQAHGLPLQAGVPGQRRRHLQGVRAWHLQARARRWGVRRLHRRHLLGSPWRRDEPLVWRLPIRIELARQVPVAGLVHLQRWPLRRRRRAVPRMPEGVPQGRDRQQQLHAVFGGQVRYRSRRGGRVRVPHMPRQRLGCPGKRRPH
mmetsp:Transcript_31280/g.74316  ORF Transcript_31280/g.74316 Transcript_31280/m.74316 type:complete len:545 (+) Transcript_31280:1261-2895(+)